LRKDMMQFLRSIARDTDLAIHITTNGTLTAPLIPELKKLGIASINLSLDTLDRERFHSITRRDDLPKVLDTFAQLQHHGIPTKINMVVMNGRNTDDIVEMARLARDHQVSVRFIEEMPFNGSGAHTFVWDHGMILQRLRTAFPDLTAVPRKHGETAQRYRSKDFKGTLGIIAAYSRTFCGTCNRLRITPVGTLRTCLYDDGIFNVRDLMRAGSTDAELKDAFLSAIGARAKNGFEAEAKRLNDRVGESMATIGG
nr:radical SAM protein [Saprospiraceae bacterium]